MAWLHAKPKPDPRSHRAKVEAEQAKGGAEIVRLSRLDQMKRHKFVPQMPPNPAPHITERLMEIGLVEASGMGTAPLSWREIGEWQRQVGIDLPPWEARLIRRLSSEDIAQTKLAESESCPPPWRAEVTLREIETEAARLRAVLG